MMRHADGGKRPSVNVLVGTWDAKRAVLYVAATDRGADRGLCAAAVRGMEKSLRGSSSAGGGGRGLCGFARCGGGAGAGGGLFGSAASVGAMFRVGGRVWAGRFGRRRDGGMSCGRMAARRRGVCVCRVERVIGSLKRRGMRRIPVFGLLGAARWARWHALTHNLMLLQGVRG